MTLHLSKYSAKLTKASFEKKSDIQRKTIIDALIIIFSSANIFNIILGEKLTEVLNENLSTLKSLGYALSTHNSKISHSNELILSLDILESTGKMCKIVESLDHLEAISFRESLIKELNTLFENLIIFCNILQVENIEAEISDRLYFVEQKNKHFLKLGNYKTGY